MKSDSFLLACKELYLNAIHPFDIDNSHSESYKRLVQLGKDQIKKNGLQEFLGFLMENQYRVNLWAAKVGLEHGNPAQDEILSISGKHTIVDCCIEVVGRHVGFQTTPEQEKNRKEWMKKIKTRYNTV